MGLHTDIEWCDSSLNLQMGCDGCELWNPKAGVKICYSGMLHAVYAGPNKKGWPESFDQPEIFIERLEPALKWADLTGKERPGKPWLNGMPRMVFLNDIGDTFTESLPIDWLAPLLPRMGASPHQFMLLTKRANRMEEFSKLHPFPNNFWPMTSITSNANLNRVAHLLRVQGGGPRCISYEPAFELVDFGRWTEKGLECSQCPWRGTEQEAKEKLDPEDDPGFSCPLCGGECAHTPLDELLGADRGIAMIIIGGASGKDAAPFEIQWPGTLIPLLRDHGCAPFVKQLGAHPMVTSTAKRPGESMKEWYDRERVNFLKWPEGTHFGNRTGITEWNGYEALLKDRKGGDWNEWEPGLRVREFPQIANR